MVKPHRPIREDLKKCFGPSSVCAPSKYSFTDSASCALSAGGGQQRVDPAILRSGRLDRHIPVGPLDRAGVRAALLADLPKGLLSDPELCLLADQLAGRVGADIACLIRAARTQARRAGTGLSAQHVKTAGDRISPCPEPDLQRRIAIHEAGHILAGHIFGLPVPRRAQLNARNGFIAKPDFDKDLEPRLDALPAPPPATLHPELADVYGKHPARDAVTRP